MMQRTAAMHRLVRRHHHHHHHYHGTFRSNRIRKSIIPIRPTIDFSFSSSSSPSSSPSPSPSPNSTKSKASQNHQKQPHNSNVGGANGQHSTAASTAVSYAKRSVSQLQHEARVEQSKRDKKAARAVTLRKLAAKGIPFWFVRDDRYFRETMDALNLTAMPNNAAGVMVEYKQLYLDSIKSFVERIHEKPHLVPVLDQLVEAGFDNLQMAKNHRRRRQHEFEATQIQKQLKRKSRQLKHRRNRAANLRKGLQLMKSQLGEQQDQESQQQQPLEKAKVDTVTKRMNNDDSPVATKPQGFFANAVSILRGWMGFQDGPETTSNGGHERINGTDNTPEENPINLEDSSPSEETPLERQLRLIEAAEESVEQTLGRMDRLEKAFANLQPHLDKKQFEMADAAIYQVMTPLCKEMADHIHRRHSRMIDQFQTLNSQTDLTKPHEWYPHARLDRRKVRRMVPIGSFQPN